VFLLDTNVISVSAPNRRYPGEAAPFAAWLAAASDFLFLSVITAAEVEAGIVKARREGATQKARALSEWWETIEHIYSDRLLPLDRPIARRAGRLIDRARAAGASPGFEDIAIAATADEYRLTVLTRNVVDFAPLGVPFADPFQTLPELPGSG
jgi:predicted nucleic acid-binding protein